MKRTLVTILSIIAIAPAWAQFSSIDGCYKGEYSEIHIKDSSFCFIYPQDHNNFLFASDTLAKCNINRLEEEWAEINSNPSFNELYRRVFNTVSIDYDFDESICDSVRVSIHLGTNRQMEASIFCDMPHKYYSHSVPIIEGKGELTISKERIGRIKSLSICPRYYSFFLMENMIRGVAGWILFCDINVKDGINSIVINIPGLDDIYFERHNVIGEYLRIKGDTIIWRGKTYTKK